MKTLKGIEIESFFLNKRKENLDSFVSALSQYDLSSLLPCWRSFIRHAEEFINIPSVINNTNKRRQFENTSIDISFCKTKRQIDALLFTNFIYFKSVLKPLLTEESAKMFFTTVSMISGVHAVYTESGNIQLMSNKPGLTIKDAINYLQSRRLYFISVLNLIPHICKGNLMVSEHECFNALAKYIDVDLNNVFVSNKYLFENKVIDNYEISFDGNVAKPNFHFSYLDEFYLEPQRLSLVDQVAFRPNQVSVINYKQLPKGKIFSSEDVDNALLLIEEAYRFYEVDQYQELNEMKAAWNDLKPFCINGFDIRISEVQFASIEAKYKKLSLQPSHTQLDYYDIVNNYSPFLKHRNNFLSTVPLLFRYFYKSITSVLMRKKRFQVHSGFVFEAKVDSMLRRFGLINQDITRINHKEFDLVMVKDGTIYNFQCKNNSIDTARLNKDYLKMARLNNYILSTYHKALLKEVNRENLLTTKLGLPKIEHFVISRYPVVTNDKRIINFGSLDEWLTQKFN